jgi:hypothetical protein
MLGIADFCLAVVLLGILQFRVEVGKFRLDFRL